MIEEDTDFCFQLIGKPWVSGASGPDSFDCWGLLRYVLQERRGVSLAAYAGVTQSGLIQMVKNAETEAKAHWSKISSPLHLCGVGMSRNKRIEHVGLWLGNGGILHCHEGGGVVFQSRASIRQTGFQNFTYYQFTYDPDNIDQ
jgi:cell wall-associated NlpC family hydrolase